jgi:hypothetical protein
LSLGFPGREELELCACAAEFEEWRGEFFPCAVFACSCQCREIDFSIWKGTWWRGWEWFPPRGCGNTDLRAGRANGDIAGDIDLELIRFLLGWLEELDVDCARSRADLYIFDFECCGAGGCTTEERELEGDWGCGGVV